MTTSQIRLTTILTNATTREQVGAVGQHGGQRAGDRVRPGRGVGEAGGDLERADQQDADADGEDDGLDEVAAALVRARRSGSSRPCRRGWSFWRR